MIMGYTKETQKNLDDLLAEARRARGAYMSGWVQFVNGTDIGKTWNQNTYNATEAGAFLLRATNEAEEAVREFRSNYPPVTAIR